MQDCNHDAIDMLIAATSVPEGMQTLRRVGEEDLIVGRHYLRFDRSVVRRIDAIAGDMVHFLDHDGTGRFHKEYFLKLHIALAPPETTLPYQGACGAVITVRNEAEAMAAFAFDGAFLGAGGRMTANAMWSVMAEASERLVQMLELKRTDSGEYEGKIREYYETYCRKWRRK